MKKSVVEEWGWSLRDNYIPNLKEKIKDYFIPTGRMCRKDFIIAYPLLMASLCAAEVYSGAESLPLIFIAF